MANTKAKTMTKTITERVNALSHHYPGDLAKRQEIVRMALNFYHKFDEVGIL